MFGWLRSKPTCPVSIEEKEWIERRFSWLTKEFGKKGLRSRRIILPTIEYFPASYHGSEEELVELMELVANYMDVEPACLRLKFYEDNHSIMEGMLTEGSSGLYVESDGCYYIWLEVSRLGDPLAVVATLAHEIGHVVLLGQRRVSSSVEDHEQLTDLLTVFLGLGIFTANGVIQEDNWRVGRFSGWSIQRSGYLTMNMFGYALALFALARGENKPSWLSHLRPDVRRACRLGIRYIVHTGDCQCAFEQR